MIYVNEPSLQEREIGYVTDCLRTGWISSSGSYIESFEREWANVCGREFGVAVANGTVALQLAVASLDLEAGDEIIMPSFTIISCALAAIHQGLKPVLVDSDAATWCMDVGEVQDRATARTKAVMPVHIYGHPVDMDPVLELAELRGWRVIEDAAEAHGAKYRSADGWTTCGSMGDVSTFSFYANKLVTTGEGGMMMTDDPAIAEKARRLRNLGFQPTRRFVHEDLGFNFRMTNLQAALGLGQVERFQEIVQRKRAIGDRYRRSLSGAPGLQVQDEASWARSVFWMFGIVLNDELDFDALELARRLADKDIETRPFFVGMHEQPVFRRMGLFEGLKFPVTERLSRRGLYLPSGLALTDDQIDTVCATVTEMVS